MNFRAMLAKSAGLAIALVAASAGAAERPNILLIYTDDVGYGDVSCYGGDTLATPNIDRIAAEGLRFTDAHCSAATCTPSRYALLTGSYAFRQRGTGIQPGDANLIIKPGSVTLPGRLQEAGYATGIVGKWHLGLGDGPIDWNGEVKPGPNEIGFDYHFLLPATGDRVPCVYLEQSRVVGLDPGDPLRVSYSKPLGDEPTGAERPDLLKQQLTHGHDNTIINGVSRIGYMSGGKAARWVDEDMADVLTTKATAYIDSHKEEPFFLMFSSHDIHVPRMPHSRFEGATGLGPRGDAMAQLDWCVGELLTTLDRLGLTDNTLVIFTSDNGPVLDDGYADQANEKLGDHRPAGPLRAGKYSAFEGGTRVPMLVRWPGHLSARGTSDALLGQVDLAASLAALVDADIPAGGLPDSRNQLAALRGDDPVGRPHLIHEANKLALRRGPWKYVPAGGTRDRLGPWKNATFTPPGALFNLDDDPAETTNLAAKHPDKIAEMAALIDQIQKAPDGDRQ